VHNTMCNLFHLFDVTGERVYAAAFREQAITCTQS
jgi:hypothetical protein